MPERFRGELLTMGCYTNPASFTFLNFKFSITAQMYLLLLDDSYCGICLL